MLNNGSQTCLVVLGMHRSGTSALTGVLQLLGVDLGKNLMKAHAGNNPRGFFENNKIHYLNEMIFRELHSSWDETHPLPQNWWQQDNLLPYQKKATEILQSEFTGSNFFGLKDPRLCVLLPFWQSIFQELHITPCYLIVIRHPFEVAASLAYREAFPFEKSVILWMNYMLHAESYSRAHPRSFIAFNEFLRNPKSSIVSLTEAFAIRFPKPFDDMEQNISKFLSPNLKHHDVENRTDLTSNLTMPPLIETFFHILQRIENNDDTQHKKFARIDALKAEYYESQRESVEEHTMHHDIEHPGVRTHSDLILAVKHTLRWKFVSLLKKIKPLRHLSDISALSLNSYHEIKFAITTKNRILLHLDMIELLPKSFELNGWAISDHKIERIEVYLEHRFMGEASYGLTRFDIQRAYPSFEDSRYSGFHFFSDFASHARLPAGKYKITVNAINANGQTCRIREYAIIGGQKTMRKKNIEAISFEYEGTKM